MSKQNVMLDSFLKNLEVKELEISNFLNEFSKEKVRREYRNDILQLSAADLCLLTAYYINANDDVKRQFDELLANVYKDQESINLFMTEFKNLYFLNKSELTDLTQFGAAKRVVLDFINKLKDEAINEKRLDKISEKNYAHKLFIVRKLKRYFSAKAGSLEIKNIDDFILMLNMIDLSEKEKNEALMLAIENNSKFYTKSVSTMKKNKIDILDEII